MAKASERWWSSPQVWVELFATSNVRILTFDIYLAHSVNQFRNEAEYIPLIFSATAPLLLILAFAVRQRWNAVGRFGYLRAAAVVVCSLLMFHFQSHFFYQRTLRSLTYSAPFAAPLSYTGLGLLLIMNRMVDPKTAEWSQWVLLLVLGGFAGNFVFSLADHAGNGFFNPLEWLPVVASDIEIGIVLFRERM